MSETIAKNKVTKVERLFSMRENKEYGVFTGGKKTTLPSALCLLGGPGKGAGQKMNGVRLSSHTWKMPLTDCRWCETTRRSESVVHWVF